MNKIILSRTRNGSSGFVTQAAATRFWGRYDTSFTVAGGEAYKKDGPQAERHILNAGHFALDLKPKEIIRLTQEFMARQGLRESSDHAGRKWREDLLQRSRFTLNNKSSDRKTFDE